MRARGGSVSGDGAGCASARILQAVLMWRALPMHGRSHHQSWDERALFVGCRHRLRAPVQHSMDREQNLGAGWADVRCSHA